MIFPGLKDKIIVFDCECYKDYSFIISYDTEKKEFKQWDLSNKSKILEFINQKDSIFVGFNNFGYDDILINVCLKHTNLTPLTPRFISDTIIKDKSFRIEQMFARDNKFVRTLDVMQEAAPEDQATIAPSLKKCEFGMGRSIEETPVSFDKSNLTDEEKDLVKQYCIEDIKTTFELFEQRIEYWKGKLELVNHFKDSFPSKNKFMYLKRTRAGLACACLKPIDKKPGWKIPVEDIKKYAIGNEGLIDFYIDVFKRYEKDIKEPGKNYSIGKCKNILLGSGGLHQAIENCYIKSDDEYVLLNYDVESFYPNIIRNNNFYSRKCEKPELFSDIIDLRIKYKKEKNPIQGVLKIVINAYYGSLGNKKGPIYDPQMALSVTVVGQLLLLQIIKEIEPICNIIQINTDGFLIRIKKDKIQLVEDCLKRFTEKYHYNFEREDIQSILQTNVNNYAYINTKGKIKSKGEFTVLDCKGKEKQIVNSMNTFKIQGIRGYKFIPVVMDCAVRQKLEGKRIILRDYDPWYFCFAVKNTASTKDKLVSDRMGEQEIEIQKINRGYFSENGYYLKNKNDEIKCENKIAINNKQLPSISDINLMVYKELIDEKLKEFNKYKEFEGDNLKLSKEDIIKEKRELLKNAPKSSPMWKF